MPFEDRKALVECIKGVVGVYAVDDSDGTVCKALEILEPDFFANGGDRKNDNVPEVKVCKEHNIEMLWNIGPDKTVSSSWYVRDLLKALEKTK